MSEPVAFVTDAPIDRAWLEAQVLTRTRREQLEAMQEDAIDA